MPQHGYRRIQPPFRANPIELIRTSTERFMPQENKPQVPSVFVVQNPVAGTSDPAEVRAEIDTVEARLTALSDQVALATVTVRLEPGRGALPVTRVNPASWASGAVGWLASMRRMPGGVDSAAM